MKAYYTVSQTGSGTKQDPYRPILPALPMECAWILCTSIPVQSPNPTTCVVLVSGSDAYHDSLKANPNVLWLADVEEEPNATT